jgi:hypothetical protein
VRIALGQFAAARERGAPADRNMGVFTHEQRIKLARFELAGQLDDIYAIVRRKVKNTRRWKIMARTTAAASRYCANACSVGEMIDSSRP